MTSPDTTALDPQTALGPASLAAWHSFRRDAVIAGKSARTVQSYGEALALLARFIGPPGEVIDVTRDQLRAFVAELAQRHSAGTANNRRASLAAWFGWAARPAECGGGEIIDASPAAGLPKIKGEIRNPAVLEDDALRALAATTARRAPTPGAEFCRLRDAAMLSLWNEAGSPRLAETAALAVADIDLAADVVTIRRGKGGRERRLALSAATGNKLSRYLIARGRWAASRKISSEALWLGERGPLHQRSIALMLARRAEAAGLGHVHPHQLRHTAYSRFEEAGGLPNDAMQLFGWSSDTMTRLYGRTAAQRRAMTRAAEIQLANL